MRIAIVSDIHGNLEAFQEVLQDIGHARADRLVSLGDNIGYGPDPDQVLRLVHGNGIRSVMGNHELGLVEPSYLNWFNASARRSLLLTGKLLSSWGREFIATLRPTLEVPSSLLVHGFPPDSITTYLFQVPEEQLLRHFAESPHRVTFVGHTHELGMIACPGKRIEHLPLREGLTHLREGHKYIVNAGSVGQPRDGNNRAKYLIFDDTAFSLEVRFIPYDIERTARKILELGFPPVNAHRLW